MHDPLKQAEQNQDLVSGWRLSATMQLRTPLKYLEMHGMRIAIEEGPPPDVPARYGSWVVTLKSYADLGIPLPEIHQTHVMASEIGPVPSDGGEFLCFAKSVRQALEETATVDQKFSRLRLFLNEVRWAEMVEQLGGSDAVISRFFKTSRATGCLEVAYETD